MGINVTYYLIVGSPLPDSFSEELWDNVDDNDNLELFGDMCGEGYVGFKLAESLDHRYYMGGFENDSIGKGFDLHTIQTTINKCRTSMNMDFNGIFELPKVHIICIMG
jgi:hypothetical protein